MVPTTAERMGEPRVATLKLDLHGLTWQEAKEEFIDFYNRRLDRAGESATPRIDVVHGYGSSGEGGVLRTRLRTFLQGLEGSLEFIPGEKLDSNPGHTVVIPARRIGGKTDLLAEAIWEYCERPRSRSKIMGKFRRHGEAGIMQALKSLEAQGRLKHNRTTSTPTYEAHRGGG